MTGAFAGALFDLFREDMLYWQINLPKAAKWLSLSLAFVFHHFTCKLVCYIFFSRCDCELWQLIEVYFFDLFNMWCCFLVNLVQRPL